MEDVISYNPEPTTSTFVDCSRPCIGGKRNLEMSADGYHSLLPEKRPQVSIMNSNNAYNNKQLLMKQQERGEKRSASELIPEEPQATAQREPTVGELEEKEIVKRITVRILSFPVDDAISRTCFHGINEPAIPFGQYVERLVHYANVWAREKPGVNSQGIRCAVLAVEYMERAQVRISSRSIHRLFLIAFLIGIKLTDDFGMSNTFWGRAGGCSLEDVNRMEVEFCNVLRWDFGVTPEVYEVQKRKFVA